MAHAQNQLTWFDHPDAVVVGSGYGKIRNSDWHVREGHRFSSHGTPCYISRNGGIRIALFKGRPTPAEMPKVLLVFPVRVHNDDAGHPQRG